MEPQAIWEKQLDALIEKHRAQLRPRPPQPVTTAVNEARLAIFEASSFAHITPQAQQQRHELTSQAQAEA